MSLQSIINGAISISVDRHRTTGFSLSRSGIVKTSTVLSNQPWQFTLEMNEGMRYSENRAVLEGVDFAGKDVESTINIGYTNPGLAYITQYQGDGVVVGTSLHQSVVRAGSASNLYVNCALITNSVASPTYLFRKGDFVQPGGSYRYVYTVTEDVAWTTAANVRIPIHRPFIPDVTYAIPTNTPSLKVGPGVEWKVKVMKKPNWTVIPWDRVTFDGAFELIEIIKDEI